nr:SIMPL domain-containing protein [Heliobacterium chlorum]
MIVAKPFSTANKVVVVFLGVIVLTSFYLSTHRVPAPPLEQAVAIDPRDVHITVTGQSALTASEVRLILAVQQGGRTANDAQQAMNKSLDKLTANLTDNGIPQENIHLGDRQIQPQWSAPGSYRTPITQGYIASTTVEISGIAVDEQNNILNVALASGANQLVKTVALPGTEAKKQAVKAALNDAGEKAKVIATSMGRELGETVSIEQTEQGNTLQLVVQYRLKF